MIKNKKGFLLGEETLKIILAVIVIIFLVYLLVSWYMNSEYQKNLKMATASLDTLISDINAGKTTSEVYNPDGFLILSWPYLEDGTMPNSCKNLGWKNCLCICDTPSKWKNVLAVFTSKTIVESYAESCSDKWVCKEVPKQTIVRILGKQAPIPIKNPPLKLNILYGNDIIIENGH
jgi:hypothetical protein